MVCLGNICRSPLAEGVLLQLLEERGLASKFRVDSAGTSAYHIGESPDPRTLEIAEKHGITLVHRARQFSVQDFDRFDQIFAMDESNLKGILKLARNEKDRTKAQCLEEPIRDPYYGSMAGFEENYQQLRRCLSRWLDQLPSFD